MNNLIKIENQELQIKEFNGQRVVTFKDVAKVHEMDFENVKRNFTNNKHHFIKNEDFFEISIKEFREKFSPNSKTGRGNPNVNMILLTESGYLMAVKSLTDDLAWKVQRQLVNCYFKVKEELSTNFVPKSNITFEQTIEMAKVIKDTPLKAMNHVFRALKVFVPELEMPEDEPEVKQVKGSKVVKDDLKFQKQLNRYLKENNLTVCSFARKNGLAKSNVWNWVNGKVTPSMPNLQIIANIIGSDLNMFL